MAKILCCGIVTLDIVNHVSHYPQEDEEIRAMRQERRSGGNAANTAQVLARHGHNVAFIGTVASDPEGGWILEQLKDSGIDVSKTVRLRGTTPTSYITLNTRNGSRTIVHHRNLNELTAEAFAQIKTDNYDWLHFEGRNIPELAKILPTLPHHSGSHRISLEAEKRRPGIEKLFPHADVILFSRSYAEQSGHTDPEAFLTSMRATLPDQLLTCTWGAKGAWYCDKRIPVRHTPPVKDIEIVDTIGAGDTFNAGLIHALLKDADSGQAVGYANRLAAQKITQHGFRMLLT